MPPRANRVVNMEVPEELADQIQRYMTQLQVTGNVPEPEVTEDGTIPWVEEVQRVLNHRIKQEKWEFQLKFASGTEWVPQEKCDCPDLIQAYLGRKKIKTTHLFCRVSTKEQTSCESTSLPLQEAKLREAAGSGTTNRIVVHKISGSAYQRIPPQLRDVGDGALGGDTIMVWRVDRLSRNIVDYLAWLEDLNKRGVNIVAHQEDLSYSHNKLDFIQGIVNAQREAEILGSRIRSSYDHRRDRGDEAVGRLPWGKKYQRILSVDGTSTVRKVVVDNTEEIALTMRIKLVILFRKWLTSHAKLYMIDTTQLLHGFLKVHSSTDRNFAKYLYTQRNVKNKFFKDFWEKMSSFPHINSCIA